MKQFKTESKKLLDLMINSIYTNREIFLRELISNASDAIDKLVFKGLTDSDLRVDRDSLAIQVAFDKDARTITVSDNGIGMTADELDENLGTIAHSGSQQFKAELAGVGQGDAADAAANASAVDIIGQFGVGFYSAFMVAKKVRVVSRALGSDAANAWESDGVSGYTVKPAEAGERDAEGDHGTDVILYLREAPADAADAGAEDVPADADANPDRLLSEWRLKELIRKYSNYVRYPIKMEVTKRRQLPKPEDAGDDYKPEWESYTELETINSIKPIWKKNSSEVEQSDYNEFYRSTFHDYADPLRTISFHAEGRISYDALVFIPGVAPFDLYSTDYEKGLALYSSGVMIQEKCSDLLPDYFNFVRGVVDSPDVTLNISRETLQQNSQLKAIARHVEKKIRAELVRMRDEDRAAYEGFFTNFGRGLKFGIYASYGMKAADLADLLLFWSERQGKMVTLAEYVDAMPEGQDKIYYAAGDSRERLQKMPVVRGAIDHGYDVLLCTEDVDEFMIQTMRAYHVKEVIGIEPTEDFPGQEAREARDLEFANVSEAGLDFATEDEKAKAKEVADENTALIDAVKEALGEKVADVRVAAGLGTSPAIITADGPVSLDMERIMSMGPEAQMAPKAQRVLELNPEHAVFAKLAKVHEDGDATKLALYADLLLDQALLVAGLPVNDPVKFAENVCELL